MRRKKEFLTPDLTPLIDVVFLLLIFFLVSSVFKKEDMALLLNLPSATHMTTQIEAKDVDIQLSKEKLAYDNTIIDFKILENKFQNISDKTKPINLRIDENVEYKRIIKVLDLLKQYELNNIALVNKKEE